MCLLGSFLTSLYHFADLLTRNTAYDVSHSTDSSYIQRRKICDAIAVASIVENCAGVDTSQNKYALFPCVIWIT